MQKKLLLMMLVPILALSFVITSCGGDDDGFVHNVELVGSGFNSVDGTDLWALFAVFDRPIDVRTRDFRVEGLRVDRHYGFETSAMETTTAPTTRPADPWLPVGTTFNPNRLIIGVNDMNMVTDTINFADFEGFGNHANAFWVNIPLAGLVHGDVVGPAHVVILHELISAVPPPLQGWAGFRLTMGDVEGYNVTHGRGARMIMADWNAFFDATNGAGLQGNWLGGGLFEPSIVTSFNLTSASTPSAGAASAETIILDIDTMVFGGTNDITNVTSVTLVSVYIGATPIPFTVTGGWTPGATDTGTFEFEIDHPFHAAFVNPAVLDIILDIHGLQDIVTVIVAP